MHGSRCGRFCPVQSGAGGRPKGGLVNRRITTIAGTIAAGLIIALNGVLLWQLFLA